MLAANAASAASRERKIKRDFIMNDNSRDTTRNTSVDLLTPHILCKNGKTPLKSIRPPGHDFQRARSKLLSSSIHISRIPGEIWTGDGSRECLIGSIAL